MGHGIRNALPCSCSSQSNPRHHPCLSFPISYLRLPALRRQQCSQPCRPRGLPPTHPITQDLVKSPWCSMAQQSHLGTEDEARTWLGSVATAATCLQEPPSPGDTVSQTVPSLSEAPGQDRTLQCGNWDGKSWDSITTWDLQRELRDSRTL